MLLPQHQRRQLIQKRQIINKQLPMDGPDRQIVWNVLRVCCPAVQNLYGKKAF
jgi:hypothetical protein